MVNIVCVAYRVSLIKIEFTISTYVVGVCFVGYKVNGRVKRLLCRV